MTEDLLTLAYMLGVPLLVLVTVALAVWKLVDLIGAL